MKISRLFVFFLALSLTQCTSGDGDGLNPTRPHKQVTCTDVPGICALSSPINTFGMELFQALHEDQPDENIFISPLSISAALTMTANGATGQTQAEMLQTLQFDSFDLPAVNADYQNFLKEIPGLDPLVQVKIANSIWYREGFPVKPTFINLNQEFFFSEVSPLDFNQPLAVETINGWIENNTNGLIKNMLDNITEEAVMYLVNAIYFKGDWLYTFEEKNTTEAPFYKQDGNTVSVDMMNLTKVPLPYLNTPTFQAVDLPYGDSLYSMLLLLPKEGNSIGDLVDDLQSTSYAEWMNSLYPANVNLSLPRFKMKYRSVLNNHLIDMGMPKAFSENADFTGIADANLFISLVLHQSFVEVNEKGTEAAAATIVGIEVTAIPVYPDLTFNKPFLFIIKERVGNNILFIGKMMDPSI